MNKDKKAYLFSNRDLRKLIVPMIIEQFLTILVGMCDSVMVASVGEHAVSGVSLVDNIFVFLIYLFSALATGGAVVIGQYLGKENRKGARKAAEQLLLFTVILSTIVTCFIYLGHDLILHHVFGKIEPDVMQASKTYLLIGTASIPFIALYNAGAAVFRSQGNAKVPMYLAFLMNSLNALGNAVLIFGFGMGVEGAGISTLVSRILAGIGILFLLNSPELPVRIGRHFSFRPDGAMLKRIAYIGIPNGMENGMFQLGKIMVLSIIAGFGTASIAANAVSNFLGLFQVLPGMAVNMAIVTVAARCIGAGDFEMARYYTQKIVKLIHIMILCFNIVIFAAMPFILKLYNLSPEAILLTKKIVIFHGVSSIFFWPPAFAFANTLRAAGDVKFCMSWSIFSMWVFRIGCCYLLGVHFGMGVFGAWVAMTIDWLVRACFFVPRYLGHKWEKKAIAE